SAVIFDPTSQGGIVATSNVTKTLGGAMDVPSSDSLGDSLHRALRGSRSDPSEEPSVAITQDALPKVVSEKREFALATFRSPSNKNLCRFLRMESETNLRES